MKKLSGKITALILCGVTALAVAAALFLGVNPSVVTIRCLEGTPVYDYAAENGYDIFPYYSYNHFDFSQQEQDFSYEISGDYAVITAYKGVDSEIYLPEQLGGKTVKKVDENTFEGKSVDVLYVPKCIDTIKCRFSSSRFDADVKLAVFFAVVDTLAAAIMLIKDDSRDGSKKVLGVPFFVCAAVLCAVQLASAVAFAVIKAPAIAAFAVGMAVMILLIIAYAAGVKRAKEKS